ncbi:MAG TPA: UDP-glucose 4-epimerase GalE [Gammaproteobacteria bacterium]|jgi:UDP-arabinose 4-epimerase|nr:UDP-glucose 4-epimerase GalE [Pseudomonadota bacterium]HAY46019.1 UDP-glucose 4-epimerase GalE [Gammaproteobacteria bacterium]
MQNSNVLVTGGAGYIGSHTCKQLAAQGYTPIVYDNLVHGNKEAVKWGPLIIGELADQDRIAKVIREHKIASVLHFAAFAYVGESVAFPEKYYRNNVAGTLSLLSTMRATAVKKIIFSSTCATYGVPKIVPISVDHPQHPINPYGRSKLVVEQILKDYAEAYGLQACVLRYFNAAGADPELEIGETHEPETHLIPNVIRAMRGELSHLDVFGSDYDTRDGSCIRDYVHVADLASAHVLALESLANSSNFTVYNLGNGEGHSVLEIIEMVEQLSGKKVPYKLAPRRAGDPSMLVADAQDACDKLAWKPKYHRLEDIVGTALAWAAKADHSS